MRQHQAQRALSPGAPAEKDIISTKRLRRAIALSLPCSIVRISRPRRYWTRPAGWGKSAPFTIHDRPLMTRMRYRSAPVSVDQGSCGIE